MEGLEATNYLNDNFPYVFLFHKLFVVLALANPLKHVTIVRVLHHNAKTALLRQSTYHNDEEFSSKKASLYPATNGFLILARIRTSFSAFSFSLSDKF